jgi:hypothetical protein
LLKQKHINSFTKFYKTKMSFLQKIFKNLQAQKPAENFAWVNELNGMDDIAAIEHATHQLNIDFKKNIFQDDQHLDTFYSIDEKMHIIVKRVSAHYINIENISIELEERIANAVFLYHRQIFLSYLSIIENPAQFQPPLLLVMLARAMNSATEMIKWRYYNYQSAPANVWLQMSQLYLIAEKYSLLESNVQIYPNIESQEPGYTTLSSAYILVCMLGSLEKLSFKCQQIEFVCTLLSKCTSKILIQKEYDEKKHLFYIDTVNDVPAKRIRNFKPADSYRYWCFDSVNSKIELYISLIEFNIPPKQQSMHEIISNKYALETMRVLRTEWSRGEYKRQRRAEDRIKTVKSATTAYGLENACNQIKLRNQIQLQRGQKHYQGNKTFEERLASHHVTKVFTESTIFYVDLDTSQSNIVDESTQGVGMHVTKHVNEVSLGMLISIFVKEEKNTARVGIIRSIKPVAGNELHIGVKVLSTSALCVEVSNMSLKSKNSDTITDNFDRFNADIPSNTHSFSCLYLPIELDVSTKETLILPKLQYNNIDLFKFNMLGKDMIVKLTEILEQHEDWLRVAFAQELEQEPR